MPVLVALLGLAFVAHATADRTTTTAASPASITATTKKVGHFEYVVTDREIDVYNIDRANRPVQKLIVPQINTPRGAVADPRTARLYISYGGQGGSWVTGRCSPTTCCATA